MSESPKSQVVIRLDQRLFYAIIALVGIAALFIVGLYVGRLTSGGSRAAAPAAAVAAAQPGAAQLPQQGVQVAQPVTSQQLGGANPFQQPAGSPVQSNTEQFGADPRVSVPELKANNFAWNFGDVKPDQKVEKILKIENSGKSELIIDNVTASCGCTAAVVASDKIPAGGSTELRVGYDPRVNKDAGKFVSRKVQVKYHFADDPSATKIGEFNVAANVSN